MPVEQATPLDLVNVYGSQGNISATDYQRLLQQYDIASYAWNTFAAPPNWVEITTYPAAPTQDTTLDEVVVEATRPPVDSEGSSFNPETGRNYPPIWQMNDSEYASFLGGGDAAYEQMWNERHAGETEAFAPPFPVLLPAAEVAGTLGAAALAALSGLLGFLIPLKPGDKYLDEAPAPYLPPPRPPTRTPLPQFDDPSPPNWQDFLHDYDFGPGTYIFPFPGDPRDLFEIGSPRERRILPISDDPGLLSPTPELPFFAEPFFPTLPAPRPEPIAVPGPDRYAPFPFGDPFAPVIGDPFPNVEAQPRPIPGPATRPGPEPAPNPYVDVPPQTFAPPKVDVPPRLADPFTPPDLVVPPFYDLIPPGADPSSPFPDLLDQYKPQRADPCNCAKTKKKEKKKKSQDRTICYEGHYIEHARGLTKVRGKEVPCDTKATRRSSPSKGQVRKRPIVPLPPSLRF